MKLSQMKSSHIDRFRTFFLFCGILMSASEIWKQYCLTFRLGGGHYNWWYFPFQLCSLPMYICLILPWVWKRPVRDIFLCFLADFGLLSGIFVFFDTSGMHYGYLPLTIHSYTWHILLIVLGIFSGMALMKDRQDPLISRCRLFAGSVCIYLSGCFLATVLNLALSHLGTINMFYINPLLPMTQKVFHLFALHLGNSAGILIYMMSVILGALCFHTFWKWAARKK